MKSLFNLAIVIIASTSLFGLFFLFTLPSFDSIDNGVLINGIPTIIVFGGFFLIWQYQQKGYRMVKPTSPLSILGFASLLCGGVLIYFGLSNIFLEVEANPTHVGPVSWDDDVVRTAYYQIVGGAVLLLLVAFTPFTVGSIRAQQPNAAV